MLKNLLCWLFCHHRTLNDDSLDVLSWLCNFGQNEVKRSRSRSDHIWSTKVDAHTSMAHTLSSFVWFISLVCCSSLTAVKFLSSCGRCEAFRKFSDKCGLNLLFC